jgi:hypothetical protein
MTTTLNAPHTIDELAERYMSTQLALDLAKKSLAEQKERLVKLLRKNGLISPGAEKSLRLEGDRYTITASFGISSSIDQDAVMKLQAELFKQKLQRTFKCLFHIETRYLIAPTAAAVVESWPKKLRELFERCTVTKPRDPSLKVEEKKK